MEQKTQSIIYLQVIEHSKNRYLLKTPFKYYFGTLSELDNICLGYIDMCKNLKQNITLNILNKQYIINYD